MVFEVMSADVLSGISQGVEMTAVHDNAIDTPTITAVSEDRAAYHDLVVFNAPADTDLEKKLGGHGWHVHMVSTDRVTDRRGTVADFLATPHSPDRAVLLGYGAAGPAVLEFADRHPERVVGVVVLAPTTAPDPGDLCCPTLTVTATRPDAAVPAIVGFLAGLRRRVSDPVPRPAPPPMLTPVLLNDPDVIERLRENGPVHRVHAPGVATSWILTGHEVSTRVLADPRLVGDVEMTAGFRLQSADSGVTHRGEQDLVTIDGEEHARLRRLVGRYLTPARVEALRPRMQRETDALLDTLPTDEPVNLLPRFALPLPIIVLCELFGVPVSDRGYIHEWLVERMTQIPPGAHTDVDDFLLALIEERKRTSSDDLLGWVVDAEGPALVEDDLISAARLLMVAGHRAPATLLANGIAALLRHREQWRRIVADPALVVPAVEELLRFVTPFPVGLARHTAAPVGVGDTRIPEDDLVSASLVAANRDPAVFPDPDVFDVGRDPNPHLAFGHGHHYCLGAALARAEAQVAIGTLARRFPDLSLAEDGRTLQYRQSRVRYLLELPALLGPSRVG